MNREEASMYVLLSVIMLLSACIPAMAEPTVVVLPFDPVVDSVYGAYGDKQSVLDYRPSLQQMIATELGKRQEILVIETADLDRYLKEHPHSDLWNDPAAAAQLASALGADYALIGTYGEFTKEIRVDARVVVAATGDVPQGNTVSAVASVWEDLPTAASRISEGVMPILLASGLLRPTSKAVLYPEGELAAYDPNRSAAPGTARLVIWVNAPAPAITSAPSLEFLRCDRIDFMNTPAEKQRTHACRVAVVPAGPVHLRVAHRGYLPYDENLELAAGKAYRLEVELRPVERLPR
jgi:TolB-like protein